MKIKSIWYLPLPFIFFSCSTSTKRPEFRDKRATDRSSPQPTPSPSTPTTPSYANPYAKTPGMPAQINPSSPPLSVSSVQAALDLEKSGRHTEALKAYVALSIQATSKKEQEDFRMRSIELIDTKIVESDLHSISRDSDFGFARGYALYRLGNMSLAKQDQDGAKRYFLSVLEILPGSDIAEKSRDVVQQLEAAKKVSPKTIGVVLPLSGKNANIGQRALRGIQMGLGLHQPFSNFKLAIMDSEGNPDNARRGVERLIREDNVIAIIGSLLSKTALAEISKAEEYGIPTIALSQKAGLTEIGSLVVRNSLTTEMQIRKLVQFAMQSLKMTKFAIIYPNDSYGTETTNIFWDEVLARGGAITSAQTYDPKDNDFRQPVQRLVGTFYIEARQEEYKQNQKAYFENNKTKNSRLNFNADDLLTPIADFDGVFIPDNAKTMGQIAAFLSYAGVKNSYLLGTNLWNVSGLAKRAGNFSGKILFVDSYNSSDANKNKFMAEYTSIYSEPPSLIEVQAFDSALILRQLVLQGADSREKLFSDLTKLHKFPGSLGNLDMGMDREIKRPLVLFTTEKGEIVPFKSSQ